MAIQDMIQHTETQAPSQYQLDIHEARIFVHDSGEGTPVLFLHGSPDSYAMWLPAIQHLGDDYRSIAIDLPGFGQSTLPDSFLLTLDHMADFVRDLVIALHIDEPVTLVTTDFGGHYGLAFTTKYPEMVRGIAISNTNFFSDYKWHSVAQLYRVPALGELLVSTATRGMMRQTLKGVAPALPDSYIDESYDAGFGSKSMRQAMLRMYRERSSSDFVIWEDKLLTILDDKPAIVLWGDKDPFASSEIADRWGNAEVHHFEEFSHWLPVEAPEQYADTLREWLEGLPEA